MSSEFDAARHGNNDQPSLFPAKDLEFWSLVNFFQIWVGISLNGVLKIMGVYQLTHMDIYSQNLGIN